MKKGFTLIELLIVMVMVAALIGVALPKYSRAVERGRALEGINNVRAAAQYAAVKTSISGGTVNTALDVVKSKNFSAPSINGYTATITRNGGSGWTYTLTAVSNEDGDITSMTCSGSDCETLGLTAEDLLK